MTVGWRITKLLERCFHAPCYDAPGQSVLQLHYGFAMNLLDSLQLNDPLFQLSRAKLALPIVVLTLLWIWETWHPFIGWSKGRLSHAGHNLLVALFNTTILAVAFGTATALVANWTTQNGIGLLNLVDLSETAKFLLAVVLLDGWNYVWHRANHVSPVLWRFHRMHHSDHHMDVTTATRFHIGEHIGSVLIRLGLIPLLGFQMWHIIAYELMVIANTQFHHANISLGRWDRWFRLVMVTPDMHKIHHSRWRVETDSNFSTLFSIWDRLAHTFRMRTDPENIEYGLSEFDNPGWQTFWGMLKTPFIPSPRVDNTNLERHHDSQLGQEYDSFRKALTVGEPHD